MNEVGTVELNMEVKNRELPGLKKNKNVLLEKSEGFKHAYSPLDWNFLRNPYLENYKILNNYNTFHLKGTAVTLNDVDSPSFIGVCQKEFECEFKAKLFFEPKQNGEEAGVTIIMNENHHYEIAIVREENINKVILRKRIGILKTVVKEYVYVNKSIILMIKADSLKYYFSFINEKDESIEMGEGETCYLSSEVAMGFTGVYIGLYTTGNGQDSREEAVLLIGIVISH